MNRLLLGACMCLAVLSAAACGDSSTTTSPSSTTTATTTSTELFTGTLSPMGSTFYSFTVANAGGVAVTLASTTTSKVGPAGSARLSLALGTPLGFGCSASSSIDTTPGLSAQLTTGSTAAGVYCVNVSDPGGLSEDVLFVIRIVHT
jgi:hypothetical protein